MRKNNDNGQMMVLETIFFASSIILSIVFLYQLSPSSVVSNIYTTDLKSIGDDALHNMYNDEIVSPQLGYPSSKLVHYIINNEYGSFVSDIRNLIPSSVLYNIYISNGLQNVFWCNSFGENDEDVDILIHSDPVVIAHCLVPIDPAFITDSCDLHDHFENYEDCMYEIRLQMWYI